MKSDVHFVSVSSCSRYIFLFITTAKVMVSFIPKGASLRKGFTEKKPNQRGLSVVNQRL